MVRTDQNISWKCFKFIPCNLPNLASELVVMTDREEFVSCPAMYKTKNLFYIRELCLSLFLGYGGWILYVFASHTFRQYEYTKLH